MEDLKNYWWMIITIPALALLIYIVARRSMKGIAIVGTIFGGTVMVFWFIFYSKWGIEHLFTGILWVVLGLGWLVKDYMRKKRTSI